MVGAEGFEPPTLCSQSRCATRLRYAPTRTWHRCQSLQNHYTPLNVTTQLFSYELRLSDLPDSTSINETGFLSKQNWRKTGALEAHSISRTIRFQGGARRLPGSSSRIQYNNQKGLSCASTPNQDKALPFQGCRFTFQVPSCPTYLLRELPWSMRLLSFARRFGRGKGVRCRISGNDSYECQCRLLLDSLSATTGWSL